MPTAPGPTPVDAYIARFPRGVAAELEAVREVIRQTVPDAEEAISYGIPTFILEGKYLVYLAGWKRHLSLYPVPAGDPALERDMAAYRSGKGTLRFPLGETMPLAFIRRVVGALAAEHDLAARRGGEAGQG